MAVRRTISVTAKHAQQLLVNGASIGQEEILPCSTSQTDVHALVFVS